jgi:NADH-quinone oxidoreductase subunit G
MPDVTFTVDGKQLTAPAGTLLIDACRTAGIEIPAFCYYPGLSLQAACRMCVVRIEKMPKLQTACTTPVAEGMIVQTETDETKQARKATLELLLGNHPLDCPVCDAGGECELQDMTFKYGASESKFVEIKQHREEQQWSPVVFFDRPRCILCYRCVRMCGEGMDVWALGVQNRGVGSVIAPNRQDHLDCEECGACIDVCPVGALTSGTYRYKTRPWEMNHVATVCTHCGDGCKVTLGIRQDNDGSEVVRGDNRDKSGINGDFLCAKGRFAFDFVNRTDRLTQPLVRQANGQLEACSWEHAIQFVGKKLTEIRNQRGGKSIGFIGSNRTTNENNYILQKFARSVIGTNNIDHHRTADFAGFVQALAKHSAKAASLRDFESAPATLVVGGDPTEQHPLLAWNIRTNVRLNNSRLYIANAEKIKLHRQAKAFLPLPAQDGYASFARSLAAGAATDELTKSFLDALRAEDSLVIALGPELRDGTIAAIVAAFPQAKFALLGDYANSRGAADMGLFPDLLPGYSPLSADKTFAAEYGPEFSATPGLNLIQMLDAAARGDLAALYVVGSNPVSRYNVPADSLKNTFLIVQDLFLTETALLADVVLPATSAYEKSGTMTNTYGDLQLVKKGGDRAGTRSDLEIIVRIAAAMGAKANSLVPYGKGVSSDLGQTRGAQSGEADRHAIWLAAHNLEPRVSPFDPNAVLDEIHRLVPGYTGLSRLTLAAGNDQHLEPAAPAGLVQIDLSSHAGLTLPSGDGLFASGTLGRYCSTLGELADAHPQSAEMAADASA